MPDVEVYAVTPEGPQRVHLPTPPASVHALPPDLSTGVYTVLRTFEHNKFLKLADHLRRLEQSMALLGREVRLDRQALRQALHEVCMAYGHPEARVRVDVLEGEAPRLPAGCRQLIALAPFVPLPEACYEEGVRVGLAPRLKRRHPRAKSTDFILARRRHTRTGGETFDDLLLDGEGRILEGSTSNFYAVRGGVVWTADEGVLEGITRGIVLQLVAEGGIPLRLEAVPLAEIARFEEAFLSSSSRGLVPVVDVDGRLIGDGAPGPVTRRLMAAYERFVARAIRPAVADGPG
jgi:branched-subunit amino acid aminotransferase/4-amino-4-deoxychorismate lyase